MDASKMRRTALDRRAAMPAALRLELSAAIWSRLNGLPIFTQAPQAFFYVSHAAEVETGAMRHLARGLGMAVAAPRCAPSGRKMQFHLLEEPEALAPGPYGILQPSPEAPLAPMAPGTVVLVPGSVFDRAGRRLGMGGGYYDRWLAGEGRGLTTIALAFDGQLVDRVPVEAHDVAMRWIVTDRECIDCALDS